MLRAAVVATALCLVPSVAGAGRLTVGVDLGVMQSKADSQGEGDRTLGVFGRLGVSSKVAIQLAVADVATDDGETSSSRKATASLVVDLLSRGRLIPTISGGFGFDSADSPYIDVTTAHHVEGGVGLEYRAAGGLTIGAELRIGTRTTDQGGHETSGRPQWDSVDEGSSTVAPLLRDGEYRSAQIKLGVRF